jgi:hypothetical protein
MDKYLGSPSCTCGDETDSIDEKLITSGIAGKVLEGVRR